MAVSFAVAGQSLYGVQCKWQQVVIRTNNDNSQVFSDYALHTINIDSMPIADYVTLRGNRGDVVTITTTDIDDQNSSAIYTDAVMTKISGNQEGHLARNINIDFRVDVS